MNTIPEMLCIVYNPLKDVWIKMKQCMIKNCLILWGKEMKKKSAYYLVSKNLRLRNNKSRKMIEKLFHFMYL